jgi:hypothetical protein
VEGKEEEEEEAEDWVGSPYRPWPPLAWRGSLGRERRKRSGAGESGGPVELDWRPSGVGRGVGDEDGLFIRLPSAVATLSTCAVL